MFFDTSRFKALETRCVLLEDELRQLRSYVRDVEDTVVHRVEKLLKRAQRESQEVTPSAPSGNGAAPTETLAARRAALQQQLTARRHRVSSSASDGG